MEPETWATVQKTVQQEAMVTSENNFFFGSKGVWGTVSWSWWKNSHGLTWSVSGCCGKLGSRQPSPTKKHTRRGC